MTQPPIYDSMSSPPSSQEAETGPAQHPPTWLIGALVVGLLLAYGQLLIWMGQRWYKSEYYGHGFLIPLISVYLICRQSKRLRDLPRRDFRWGPPVVAAALLLHLLATWLDVHFPSGFALVVTIFGLVIWLWGWPTARAAAFPIGFLMFMVPLARLLVDQFAQPLQLLGANLAGWLAYGIGMDTIIEGTTIHTPVYTFEVAIACSGLKSSIAMSALAALLSYLVVAPLGKKIVLFLTSVPVALLANASRIFVTLVLGQTVGPKAAEGFFHSVSGILVFLIGFAGLFLVARGLGCWQLRDDI